MSPRFARLVCVPALVLLAGLIGVYVAGLPLASRAPVYIDHAAVTLARTERTQNERQALSPRPDSAAQSRARATYARLPLRFEANHGQTDPRVRYLARGSGYTLFLTPDEAVLALRAPAADGGRTTEDERRTVDAVVRMRLVGANRAPRVAGLDELPGKSHYLLGSDPAQWRTDVPAYSRVRYENVYPGVDLVYYGNQGQLEFDLVVAPGADHHAIRLGFTGADKITRDRAGDLILHVANGELRQHRPVAYQEIDGARRTVQAEYVLLGKDEVGFRVGDYDRARPLILDPVLAYSSFLGGGRTETGQAIAVDRDGNAYVTGDTNSTDFPTTTLAYDPACGTDGACNGTRDDVFVAKLNAAGDGLVYATYLGGSARETGLGIAVDEAGSAYVAGQTASTDFPTTTLAYDPACDTTGPCFDTFVTKLNAQGDGLIYSTYLGGSDNETPGGIDVGVDGSAYVAGETTSPDFPTTTLAFDPDCGSDGACDGGLQDNFVTRLNAEGSDLVYSTYLGGRGDDYKGDLAVDGDGSAYVTGETNSTDFPTTTLAFDTTCGTPDDPCDGSYDAFVTKLDPDGEELLYSTFLGGVEGEAGHGIAVDGAGHAYVTGSTSSADFPTTTVGFGSDCATAGSCFVDVFATRLDPDGSGLAYSTVLGGARFDIGNDIAVDAEGSASITGWTDSTDFPTTTHAYDPTCGNTGDCGPPDPLFGNPPRDVFVAILSPTADELDYATYLGGNANDLGNAIAVDAEGSAYVTGFALSLSFPTTEQAPDRVHAGGSEAFVLKLASDADLAIAKSDTPDPAMAGERLSYTLAISNVGSSRAASVTVSDTLPAGTALISAAPSQGDCASNGLITCNLGTLGPGDAATVTLEVEVDPSARGTLVNQAEVSGRPSDPDPSNNSATEETSITTEADLRVAKADEPDPVAAGSSLSYTLTVANDGPSTATGITLSDTLPSFVTFESAAPSQGGCEGGAVVRCELGSVAPGQVATVTIVVEVRPLVSGTIINAAVVEAGEADPNSLNNQTTEASTITSPNGTPIPTASASPSPTVEQTVTAGPSPTASQTPTEGPSPTASTTPTFGPSPTSSATVTAGPSPTASRTVTPGASPTPSNTATLGPTPSATRTWTPVPSPTTRGYLLYLPVVARR